MQKDSLNNINISDEQILITPDELKAKFPLNDAEQRDIAQARATIADIIHGRDDRLLIVCGPCSIHDTDAALEYARRLQSLAAELNDRLYIVMRVYFENRVPPWVGKGSSTIRSWMVHLMWNLACILRAGCYWNW